MADTVLILGGYGVFGGRLARRLSLDEAFDVIVAGRSLDKAQAHCRAFGGIPLALDRDGDLDAAFAQARPTIVIDAAGPFQTYRGDPYRVARATIRAGSHYLDLADDAAFVAGIVELEAEARAAGVCVISGASSVPAISAAALDQLTRDLVSVALVGSVILPGNRAPRGLSVIRAIVEQVGRPLRQWRGGRWRQDRAWGDLTSFKLDIAGTPGLPARLASRIGAPDLLLFPKRYGARSVLFHAGLELTIMQIGLWLLALPVRLGLCRSLAPLSGWLKWAADRLSPFGTDRGGMMVYALGRNAADQAVERRWTLIAIEGVGPEIPPMPAFLLTKRFSERDQVDPGARPAAGELLLGDIEEALSPLGIRMGRSEHFAPPLLERVLPDQFARLPPAWRRLADIHDVDHFRGMASVERGTSIASRLIAWLIGFPPAAQFVTVTVEKRKTERSETWIRSFDGKRFVSHLSRHANDEPGVLRERFGPFTFRLRLHVDGANVNWPVESWRLLGVPMPRSLMPSSATSESCTPDGKFQFDVGISLPFAGLIVRYRGWLVASNGI